MWFLLVWPLVRTHFKMSPLSGPHAVTYGDTLVPEPQGPLAQAIQEDFQLLTKYYFFNHLAVLWRLKKKCCHRQTITVEVNHLQSAPVTVNTERVCVCVAVIGLLGL